jgi:putative ABC transport system substrate-binding protein
MRESSERLAVSRKKRGGKRMMGWSVVCLPLAVFLFTAPVAQAQHHAKLYRVGFLSTGFPGSNRGLESIRRALRELAYVEGKNIAFEDRYAENRPERSRALANELVRLRVDVIVAGGTNDTLAAKSATTMIPIVFLESVSNPVEQGLVASLARPGGNVTGFTTIAWVLAGKRLELLKDTIPKLSRVAVLWDPQSSGNPPQWEESQRAARQLGLQLHSMKVSSAGKYENAFNEAAKTGSAALAVTRHRSSSAYQKQIIELAAKHRLPAIYPRADFVENGGLISYGAADAEPYRRAASMIDKILKGAKPADLPVEQPTKSELVINLKTAKALGLKIPAHLLMEANKVIE